MSLRLPIHATDVCGFDWECRNDGSFDGGSPDAGAGGGAEPPADTSAEPPAGDDHSDAPAAHDVAPDDGDDDGDDHGDLADLANDPRVRRVLNRNRKLSRRLAETRPTMEQLRAFGVKDNLREIVEKAGRYDQIAPTVTSAEFVRWLASQGQDPAEPARREPDPPAFDDSDFPFDPNETAGRYLHQRFSAQHAENAALRQALTDVTKRLATIERGTQAEHQKREVGGWRTALDAAAAKVPESVNGYAARQAFRDAVIGVFHQARQRGVRLDPQKVIAHYLQGLPAKTQAAASAAAQRIAENNKTLPGRQNFSGGTPAAATRDRKNERVRDVSRRFLGGQRIF